jgi:hypothetical protein
MMEKVASAFLQTLFGISFKIKGPVMLLQLLYVYCSPRILGIYLDFLEKTLNTVLSISWHVIVVN